MKTLPVNVRIVEILAVVSSRDGQSSDLKSRLKVLM